MHAVCCVQKQARASLYYYDYCIFAPEGSVQLQVFLNIRPSNLFIYLFF